MEGGMPGLFSGVDGVVGAAFGASPVRVMGKDYKTLSTFRNFNALINSRRQEAVNLVTVVMKAVYELVKTTAEDPKLKKTASRSEMRGKYRAATSLSAERIKANLDDKEDLEVTVERAILYSQGKLGSSRYHWYNQLNVASGICGRSSDKKTALDILRVYKEYDLQLRSWGDGSQVPTSGQDFVIAGTDNNGLLHIRSFDPAGVRADTYEAIEGGEPHLVTADASGNILSDVAESSLSKAQSQAIAALKQQLPVLLLRHVLTQAKGAQVLSRATSITGDKFYKDVNKIIDLTEFKQWSSEDHPFYTALEVFQYYCAMLVFGKEGLDPHFSGKNRDNRWPDFERVRLQILAPEEWYERWDERVGVGAADRTVLVFRDALMMLKDQLPIMASGSYFEKGLRLRGMTRDDFLLLLKNPSGGRPTSYKDLDNSSISRIASWSNDAFQVVDSIVSESVSGDARPSAQHGETAIGAGPHEPQIHAVVDPESDHSEPRMD
jgi:hypothetical protein